MNDIHRTRGDMKEKLIFGAEILLVAILSFICCYSDIFYSLDSLMKDKIYQQPRAVDSTIKIIAIDEETLQELGPFGTWSRETYAEILEILGDYPAVVGFDIMFMGEMDEEGDRALTETLRQRDNVVLASHLVYDTVYVRDAQGKARLNPFYISQVELPFCAQVTKSGYANVTADTDGIIRSLIPELTRETEDGTTETYQGFSYLVYQTYCEKTGQPIQVPAVDANGQQWLYYASKPYEYENISLIKLLNQQMDSRVFTDCIVLVGAYANGLQDQFSVPNSSNQMYGVEIHANMIQSLLEGHAPVPLNRTLAASIVTIVVVALYCIFKKMHIRWGTVAFLCSEVIYVIVGTLLYTRGNVMIPLFYGMFGIFVAYLVALVGGYMRERIEKHKIANAFRKYVAPQVVDDIMRTGKYQIKLGGENRNIAVLFVDIRGFTPLSESLQPEQVVEILNEYLNLTTNSIFRNQGTLDKFIGDATMAVFNAPFDLDDYVFRAVCAAWDICAGAKELEESCKKRFGRSVAFGVGVNCGEAVVGNIGCDFRMDYTAIGDTVNTAARLEANAKRGQVLISEAVYNQVKERVTVEEVGEIPMKGKSQGVFVYSLVGVEGKEAIAND